MHTKSTPTCVVLVQCPTHTRARDTHASRLTKKEQAHTREAHARTHAHARLIDVSALGKEKPRSIKTGVNLWRLRHFAVIQFGYFVSIQTNVFIDRENSKKLDEQLSIDFVLRS